MIRLAIQITEAQDDKLRLIAYKKRISVSQAIRDAIEAYDIEALKESKEKTK